MAFKRSLAVLLAGLQVALSFSLGGYAAAAEVVVQSVKTSGQTQVTGLGSVGVPLGNAAAVQPGFLAPLSSLSGALSLPSVPQVQASQLAPSALPLSVIPSAAAPVLSAPAVLSRVPAVSPLTLAKPAAAAPQVLAQPAAGGQQGPARLSETSARVGESLSLPGLSAKAPAESSKGAAEQVFAELRGEKLISSSEGAVAATPAAAAALRSGAPALAKAQAAPAASNPKAVPAAQSPAQAKPFWQKPAVKVLAGVLGAAGLVAAGPLLAANVGLVAAAGSVTLSLLGVPQIIKNFQAGRQGTKDVVMAGPLMWFAAASLLALVGIGNGSSIWWNAANLAGVAESATVVAQLNYYKKDPKSLKATLATVAGVALPIALIASQALMPLSAGLSVAFTAAMVLLGALDTPQIAQNDAIFRNEGRSPQGISPWFKGLLVAGSLMHLFAAIMGGDLRWTLNAAFAIIMGTTVLAQMYLPAAAHAVLGPLVRAAEKLLSAFGRGAQPAVDPAQAGAAEAKALIEQEFQGADYMRFQSQDSAKTLADIQEKAKALPGRSAILLEAPTAAGKSTLAEVMRKGLGGRMKVFPVDLYFRSANDIPRDPQGRPDYDRPEALHLQRAADDVKTLLAGGRIELPKHVMDGPTTFDSGEFLQLGPDDVIIVDSIFASHQMFLDAVKGRQTLNVYLAAPAAIRLARRLKRDKTERGISVQNNLKGWSHLLANERANILPLREKADVVVNLMTAEELSRLPQALAELLAAERAANSQDAAQTELFLKMVRASIAADTGAAEPALDPVLEAALAASPSYLSSESVADLSRRLGTTPEGLLPMLLPFAKRLARPSLTGKSIGAAALGASGAVYLGGNVEVFAGGISLNTHAEQRVVMNALSRGERGLLALAVSAAPCGGCLQFLHELAGHDGIRFLITGAARPLSISDLLPNPYGKQGSLLLPRSNGLSLPGRVSRAHLALAQAALAAAEMSYASPSVPPSGVALRTRDGRVYLGPSVDIPGHSHNMHPLQAALAAMASDGAAFSGIVEAALVEPAGRIRQQDSTRRVLAELAPGVKLRVYTAVKAGEAAPQGGLPQTGALQPAN